MLFRERSFLLLTLTLIIVAGGFVVPRGVGAIGTLSFVSDTITDSSPGATTTNHTIRFTTTNAIPLGGHIIITPEANGADAFTVPVLMSSADIDLDVTTGVTTVNRPLSDVASVLADKVTIIPGTSGYFTIDLTAGAFGNIPAGSTVEIRIGDNAIDEALGTQYLTNPSGLTSYRIRLETRDATGGTLDMAAAMIALVQKVKIERINTGDLLPPTRFNGLPSGNLLGSTAAVQISLSTDRDSVCHYDTAPGIIYGNMLATMTPIAFGYTHFYNIFGIVSSTTYTYYVRCANQSRVFNTDDFIITFATMGAIGSATNTFAGIPVPGPITGTQQTPQGASSFSGPGPVGGPYLIQGLVTIDGDTIPGMSLVVLKDGEEVKTEAVDSSGHFTIKFDGLDRGTYSWGMYAKDQKGHHTSTYTSVIYLIGGSNNIIAPIYISPTIYGTSTVGLGERAQVEGYGIAKKPVRVIMSTSESGNQSEIITATTTTDGNGYYRIMLPTNTLNKGTYEVKAQSIINGSDESIFSPVLYLGVGQSPKVDFSLRADLNKDGKVNLVDFSILLFNWKTGDPVADINQDGIVNLTDFSIMLSFWTG